MSENPLPHNLSGLYVIEDCTDYNKEKADQIIKQIKTAIHPIYFSEDKTSWLEDLMNRIDQLKDTTTAASWLAAKWIPVTPPGSLPGSLQEGHSKKDINLILGTMNILGDAVNPFEFKPPDAYDDKSTYTELVEKASKPFKEWTFEEAFEAFEAADSSETEPGQSVRNILAKINKHSGSIYDYFFNNKI